jgi:hypothetical protein
VAHNIVAPTIEKSFEQVMVNPLLRRLGWPFHCNASEHPRTILHEFGTGLADLGT